MLPTSQLRPTGTFCSYPAETSADIKSEITPIQIEEARASGRLYIKDCDIEYLPLVTKRNNISYNRKLQQPDNPYRIAG